MITRMYLTFMNDRQFNNHISSALDDNINKYGNVYILVCPRGDGYFNNKKLYLDTKKQIEKNGVAELWLYTNDETMLDYMSTDLFNGRLNSPDLFIQNTEIKDRVEYRDLRKLSANDKEIRLAHNIRKIILSGCYKCIPLIEED